MDHQMPAYDLGVIGGGVAVQMALPALVEYGKIAINYRIDTPHTYPQFDFVSDLSEIMDPRTVAALFIATPVQSHIDLVRRAAQAGIPTLLEKPLAASLANVRQIDLGSTRDIVIAFRKRYSDVAEAIKNARRADPKTPSDLQLTWLAPHPGLRHWKASRRAAGGGVSLDIASHVLDLIEYSVAPVDVLRVIKHRVNEATKSDEYLDLKMTLRDQSRVSAQIGWAEGDPVQSLTLVHGRTRLLWLKEAKSSDSVLYTTVQARSKRVESRRQDEYRRMLADFRVFVDTGEPGRLAHWREGVRNLELISRIFDQIDGPNATIGV